MATTTTMGMGMGMGMGMETGTGTGTGTGMAPAADRQDSAPEGTYRLSRTRLRRYGDGSMRKTFVLAVPVLAACVCLVGENTRQGGNQMRQ